MLIESINQYSIFVDEYEVERYRHGLASYELLARVTLNDHSILHLKDYLFRDQERKYAYQW